MKRILVLSPIMLLILTACQTPTPTAQVATTPVAATATPRPIVQAATPTALPPTVAPTATPQPTATPVAATLSATLSAATSTAVPTTTPTATATPAATPTKLATPASREVIVNGDGVNFRDTPSTSGNILQVLSQGTPLTAIDLPTAPDAGGIAWQNVRTDDGRSGWVAAQLLSAATATPTPPPVPSSTPSGAPSGTPSAEPTVTPVADAGYVYVSSVNGLNLRVDHSASSNIVAQLADGQRLQTNGLGFGPDDRGLKWLNVKTEHGTVGWVAADFVSTEVPSVKPAEPPTNESDIAAELLRRTNALRQQNGLPPYTLEAGLNLLALEHSQYMAQNGVTHTDGEGLSASKRIANAGYDGRPTENIYGGLADIEVVWTYWSTDPPHLQNLLNSVNTYIGIGVYKAGPGVYYYTQDFAGPFQ